MIGLFVGRFQPFHDAHLQIIQNALKEVEKLIIGVGSSQYSETAENPFTYEERKEMITFRRINTKFFQYQTSIAMKAG